MDALVEAHDEEEVERAIKSGARIIGVNNRDLKTFEVDMQNSIRLRKLAPDNVIFVSESGIQTSEDIKKLHENQIEAVLIGETLMRSPDKKAALEELNGADVYKRQLCMRVFRRMLMTGWCTGRKSESRKTWQHCLHISKKKLCSTGTSELPGRTG